MLKTALSTLAVSIFLAALYSAVLMFPLAWLWDWKLVPVLGLRPISFAEAWCLLVSSRLLFQPMGLVLRNPESSSKKG